CILHVPCSRLSPLALCSPFLSPPLFFFNDPAPTEISTLSLHDALPICEIPVGRFGEERDLDGALLLLASDAGRFITGATIVEIRSEEHTSELQSLTNLVCRLLLEKKKKTHLYTTSPTAHACHLRTPHPL